MLTFQLKNGVLKYNLFLQSCVIIKQGNSLDAPLIEKDGEIFSSSTGVEVGASGMQGWRLEMEDSHIVTDIPSREDHLFLAVFDGHAGAGAAKYASKNMVAFLEKSEEWSKYLDGNCQNIELLGDALINAFVEIDEKMKLHQDSTYGKDTSGCTAVACIMTPKYIICANTGDSRCVMGTNGVAKPLSDDHKPYNETERKRIEAAGGFVQWNRVDGDLAVSRALGDFSYKNRPDLPPKDQKVAHELLKTSLTQQIIFRSPAIQTSRSMSGLKVMTCCCWLVMDYGML